MAVPEVEELVEGEPAELVVENARRKACAVAADRVLGVDTIVAVEGRPFGKPADRGEAEAVLRRLSGRAHEVHGGIALRDAQTERVGHAVTTVRFRELSGARLRWYLETGEWRERAGGYAIQGRGGALVESVQGDPWNVVGLPVAELVRLAPDLFAGPATPS